MDGASEMIFSANKSRKITEADGYIITFNL